MDILVWIERNKKKGSFGLPEFMSIITLNKNCVRQKQEVRLKVVDTDDGPGVDLKEGFPALVKVLKANVGSTLYYDFIDTALMVESSLSSNLTEEEITNLDIRKIFILKPDVYMEITNGAKPAANANARRNRLNKAILSIAKHQYKLFRDNTVDEDGNPIIKHPKTIPGQAETVETGQTETVDSEETIDSAETGQEGQAEQTEQAETVDSGHVKTVETDKPNLEITGETFEDDTMKTDETVDVPDTSDIEEILDAEEYGDTMISEPSDTSKQSNPKYIMSKKSRVYHLSTCKIAHKIKPFDLIEIYESDIDDSIKPCARCIDKSIHHNIEIKAEVNDEETAEKQSLPEPKTQDNRYKQFNPVGRQLMRICDKYDIYCELCGDTALIMTAAGDWKIDYMERPVRLWHKNYRTTVNGSANYDYHIQSGDFYSPIDAIFYLIKHDNSRINRLLNDLN